MLDKFLNSSKPSKEFIEDTIISSAITNVTDAPPETRIKKPEDEIKVINLTKDK